MKYVATLNGKKYEVEVEKAEKTYRPLSRSAVASSDSSSAAAPSASASAGKDSNVVSPMPGVILAVKVAVGDSVKSGQTLIVLEAMKMENEIVAPSDGVVASIPVKKGDTVESDATLVVLK